MFFVAWLGGRRRQSAQEGASLQGGQEHSRQSLAGEAGRGPTASGLVGQPGEALVAPGSQVERGARCDRLVAARGAAWRPPHRDGTEGDALLGGAVSRAGPLSEACDEVPLEAVEKHARIVQSWLGVQRARGGQAETAKAL